MFPMDSETIRSRSSRVVSAIRMLFIPVPPIPDQAFSLETDVFLVRFLPFPRAAFKRVNDVLDDRHVDKQRKLLQKILRNIRFTPVAFQNRAEIMVHAFPSLFRIR